MRTCCRAAALERGRQAHPRPRDPPLRRSDHYGIEHLFVVLFGRGEEGIGEREHRCALPHAAESVLHARARATLCVYRAVYPTIDPPSPGALRTRLKPLRRKTHRAISRVTRHMRAANVIGCLCDNIAVAQPRREEKVVDYAEKERANTSNLSNRAHLARTVVTLSSLRRATAKRTCRRPKTRISYVRTAMDTETATKTLLRDAEGMRARARGPI